MLPTLGFVCHRPKTACFMVGSDQYVSSVRPWRDSSGRSNRAGDLLIRAAVDENLVADHDARPLSAALVRDERHRDMSADVAHLDSGPVVVPLDQGVSDQTYVVCPFDYVVGVFHRRSVRTGPDESTRHGGAHGVLGESDRGEAACSPRRRGDRTGVSYAVAPDHCMRRSRTSPPVHSRR